MPDAKKFLRLLCATLWTLAGLMVLSAGLEREVVRSARDSSRTKTWRDLWHHDGQPDSFPLQGACLPPQLPGPLDTWAGGRTHRVTTTFDLSPGWYTVQLDLYESHQTAPPRLAVTLNGQPVKTLQVRAGAGRAGPYHEANPELQGSFLLRITALHNTLALENVEGSWIAPASLRVLRARPSFFAAKAGFQILARDSWFYGLLALLAAGFWAAAAIRQGPARALAQTLLMAFSTALSLGAAELLYRQYLILNPGHRVVSTARPATATEDDRKPVFTYETMIEPDSHPAIPYRLRRGLDGRFGNYPLRTNQDRMRGPEVTRAKAPGTLRVLGLGDSVMFGWGVSYEDTALTLLGGRLQEALGEPVETLNTGCPSYDTAVEVAVLQTYGLAYDPDLVILTFLQNDLGFPGAMIEPVEARTLRKSYLREQLRRRLAQRWGNAPEDAEAFVSTRALDRLEAQQDVATNEHDRLVLRVRDHYAHLTGHDAVRGHLADLAETLHTRNIQGLIIYNPIRLRAGDPSSYEPDGAWVVQQAKELGLLAVDMSPYYDRYTQEQHVKDMREVLSVNPEDWHPNAAGHRLQAEAVMQVLRESGTLDLLRARAQARTAAR